jgi:hypothetical protein
MAYYYELTDNKEIYSKKKIKTIYEISILINQWKAAWIDTSCTNRPRLYIDKDPVSKDRYLVVDSRFKNEITYGLTNQEAEFLTYLNLPRSLNEINTDVPHTGSDMLKKLQSLQLLFEEDGTYLSLVCSKQNTNFRPILPETLNDILENDKTL